MHEEQKEGETESMSILDLSLKATKKVKRQKRDADRVEKKASKD